jgi:hypothetical protein
MRLIPSADEPRAERRRLGESLYHVAFEDFTQMQQALCGGATIDEVAREFGLPHHEVVRPMARNVVTAVDGADFFVQAFDAVTPIITAPITSVAAGYTSPDQKNTLHKGAMLYMIVTSLSTAVSLAVRVNGKENVTGTYVQIGAVSLDATSMAAGAQNIGIQVYPGLLAQTAIPSTNQPAQINAVLPAVFQVVVSAAAAPGTFSFKMGQTKIL